MFFLDYYATAKLDSNEAAKVVKGIAEGCKISQCALIGGETAEMPGMYMSGDFDLAGFAVGVAERSEIDRSSLPKEGDTLIALPSSGIHSNGFSLVRKLLFEKLDMDFEEEFDSKPLIETLLEPTKIYVKEFKENKENIKALAHITGGGIVENLPRVLPKNLNAQVYKRKIRTLKIFDFMSKYVKEEEMFRTFNMGVGMILVVDSEVASEVALNCGGYEIGNLVKGSGVVELI
jgi:phosphoribosylformylglycinamidine cyclo-ligase